jgi:hypothetical protein
MTTESQPDSPTPAGTVHAGAVPTFGECPECGLVAEVSERFVIGDDLIECAAIRCIAGHQLRCPIEFMERRRTAGPLQRLPRLPEHTRPD